jgi:phosphoglycerate dehydrogenase-like enzyme
MKIVVVDHVFLEEQHVRELEALGELKVYGDPPRSDEDLKERIRDADIVIVGWSHFTKSILDSVPKLKMISIWATTCHYADLEEAERRGIVVTHVPGYGTEAVAEQTIALMLAAVRKLVLEDRHVREGKFDWRPFKGIELAGKTLGIVGTGAIGCRVGEIAKAFGMRMLGYDIQRNPKAQEVGISYVDLETLLRQSDIVSLHVTLTTKSKRLIGEKEFAMMKNGAVFVNTSQGKVVDENALAAALSSGKLSCAGLDVFAEEPPTSNNPLFKLENTALSPHVGFHTVEAVKRCSDICVDNVKRFVEGHPTNICTSQ